MASDNEACCESDPNFAVICGFLEKFGVTCGLANIDFLDLQYMLENSLEVPQVLIDLHVKLLRKARKSVSSERWERAVIKFCHGFCSQDAWEIERFGYKKARLSSKLRILKELLEMQFDYNAKFKNEVNKLSAEELRTQPLGKDRLGHVYWYQSDEACQIRVYKEDPDEETWALVVRSRDDLLTLITDLNDGKETVLNEDSNSLESEKPIIDTGQTDSNSDSSKPDQLEKVEESPEETSSESKQMDDDSIKKSAESEEELKAADSTEAIDLQVKESQRSKSDAVEVEEKVNAPTAVVSPPKAGINLRIKPIGELLSTSTAGIKEKYIRSEPSSILSFVHHRKAVDSAGFDVHANYLKRPLSEVEDDEVPAYIKRSRMDRPTLLGNKKKKPYSEEEEDEEEEDVDEEEEDEVSDEIEEPLMLVKGEGSGHDNKVGNVSITSQAEPIVSEEIVEEVIYFHGVGNGVDCGTGNDNKDAEPQSSTLKSVDESEEANETDSINQDGPSTSAQDSGSLVTSKTEFKLGTIIDIRTNNLPSPATSPIKRSRWDIGKPSETASVESQSVVTETKKLFECSNVDNNVKQTINLFSAFQETPKGKVTELVNIFEQIDTKKDNENQDVISVEPKRSMFFFGPGSLTVKPPSVTYKIGDFGSPTLSKKDIETDCLSKNSELQEKDDLEASETVDLSQTPNKSTDDKEVVPTETLLSKESVSVVDKLPEDMEVMKEVEPAIRTKELPETTISDEAQNSKHTMEEPSDNPDQAINTSLIEDSINTQESSSEDVIKIDEPPKDTLMDKLQESDKLLEEPTSMEVCQNIPLPSEKFPEVSNMDTEEKSEPDDLLDKPLDATEKSLLDEVKKSQDEESTIEAINSKTCDVSEEKDVTDKPQHLTVASDITDKSQDDGTIENVSATALLDLEKSEQKLPSEETLSERKFDDNSSPTKSFLIDKILDAETDTIVEDLKSIASSEDARLEGLDNEVKVDLSGDRPEKLSSDVADKPVERTHEVDQLNISETAMEISEDLFEKETQLEVGQQSDEPTKLDDESRKDSNENDKLDLSSTNVPEMPNNPQVVATNEDIINEVPSSQKDFILDKALNSFESKHSPDDSKIETTQDDRTNNDLMKDNETVSAESEKPTKNVTALTECKPKIQDERVSEEFDTEEKTDSLSLICSKNKATVDSNPTKDVLHTDQLNVVSSNPENAQPSISHENDKNLVNDPAEKSNSAEIDVNKMVPQEQSHLENNLVILETKELNSTEDIQPELVDCVNLSSQKTVLKESTVSSVELKPTDDVQPESCDSSSQKKVLKETTLSSEELKPTEKLQPESCNLGSLEKVPKESTLSSVELKPIDDVQPESCDSSSQKKVLKETTLNSAELKPTEKLQPESCNLGSLEKVPKESTLSSVELKPTEKLQPESCNLGSLKKVLKESTLSSVELKPTEKIQPESCNSGSQKNVLKETTASSEELIPIQKEVVKETTVSSEKLKPTGKVEPESCSSASQMKVLKATAVISEELSQIQKEVVKETTVSSEKLKPTGKVEPESCSSASQKKVLKDTAVISEELLPIQKEVVKETTVSSEKLKPTGKVEPESCSSASQKKVLKQTAIISEELIPIQKEVVKESTVGSEELKPTQDVQPESCNSSTQKKALKETAVSSKELILTQKKVVKETTASSEELKPTGKVEPESCNSSTQKKALKETAVSSKELIPTQKKVVKETTASSEELKPTGKVEPESCNSSTQKKALKETAVSSKELIPTQKKVVKETTASSEELKPTGKVEPESCNSSTQKKALKATAVSSKELIPTQKKVVKETTASSEELKPTGKVEPESSNSGSQKKILKETTVSSEELIPTQKKVVRETIVRLEELKPKESRTSSNQKKVMKESTAGSEELKSTQDVQPESCNLGSQKKILKETTVSSEELIPTQKKVVRETIVRLEELKPKESRTSSNQKKVMKESTAGSEELKSTQDVQPESCNLGSQKKILKETTVSSEELIPTQKKVVKESIVRLEELKPKESRTSSNQKKVMKESTAGSEELKPTQDVQPESCNSGSQKKVLKETTVSSEELIPAQGVQPEIVESCNTSRRKKTRKEPPVSSDKLNPAEHVQSESQKQIVDVPKSDIHVNSAEIKPTKEVEHLNLGSSNPVPKEKSTLSQTKDLQPEGEICKSRKQGSKHTNVSSEKLKPTDGKSEIQKEVPSVSKVETKVKAVISSHKEDVLKEKTKSDKLKPTPSMQSEIVEKEVANLTKEKSLRKPEFPQVSSSERRSLRKLESKESKDAEIKAVDLKKGKKVKHSQDLCVEQPLQESPLEMPHVTKSKKRKSSVQLNPKLNVCVVLDRKKASPEENKIANLEKSVQDVDKKLQETTKDALDLHVKSIQENKNVNVEVFSTVSVENNQEILDLTGKSRGEIATPKLMDEQPTSSPKKLKRNAPVVVLDASKISNKSNPEEVEPTNKSTKNADVTDKSPIENDGKSVQVDEAKSNTTEVHVTRRSTRRTRSNTFDKPAVENKKESTPNKVDDNKNVKKAKKSVEKDSPKQPTKVETESNETSKSETGKPIEIVESPPAREQNVKKAKKSVEKDSSKQPNKVESESSEIIKSENVKPNEIIEPPPSKEQNVKKSKKSVEKDSPKQPAKVESESSETNKTEIGKSNEIGEPPTRELRSRRSFPPTVKKAKAPPKASNAAKKVTKEEDKTKTEDKTVSRSTRSHSQKGTPNKPVDLPELEKQITKAEVRPMKKFKMSESVENSPEKSESNKPNEESTVEDTPSPPRMRKTSARLRRSVNQVKKEEQSKTVEEPKVVEETEVAKPTEELKAEEPKVVEESKDKTDDAGELIPVVEPPCVEKIVPLLTVVDISTLKNPDSVDEVEAPKEPTVQVIDSGDSDDDHDFGADNVGVDDDDSDSVIIIPEDDPLAGTEPEVEASTQPMTLATFKLDADDSPAPSPARVTRKRAAQQSVDALRENQRKSKRPQLERKDDDSKRPKLKPKRSVDLNLRRSIEQQKLKEVSSSEDDNAGTPTKNKNSEDAASVSKRRSSTRSLKAVESDSETPKVENPPSADKKTKKTKRILLGLEISPEMENLLKDDTPVRQSRRIAQIKIKEEAERRKLEEVTLNDLKEEQRKRKVKKDVDKDYKLEKRKRNKASPTEDETTNDAIESDEKKKRKRKRKHWNPHKQFDVFKAWNSSSGSSSSEVEDEEEEIEDDDDHQVVLKSDHEFSPESDLEEGTEVQPLKRARTARKESDAEEEEVDDCACQKCGQKDHPEWILLCDSCDSGWHCSCLRPALLVIPEGDWFCPPCQHITLVKKLESQLLDYDKKMNKREMEIRRKERLAYVGISLDNVLPSKEPDEHHRHKSKHHEEAQPNTAGDNYTEESGSDDSDSESESSSSTESDSDEPVYQLRERRQAHSYRFNDYDDLINSAIQEELDAVNGAGNQGRGKDIATIVNATQEEATAELVETKVDDPQEPNINSEPTNQVEAAPVEPVEPEQIEPEPLPPVVPLNTNIRSPEQDSEEEIIRPVKKKLFGKKKHRKLNSLDVSSGDDDADSDEDFKGNSSSDSEEGEEEYSVSESSDESRRGKRRKGSGPIRRSTRARVSRYDKDFINDTDSGEEAPRRKKTRSIWDESESEESDGSWGGKGKRKPKRVSRKKPSMPSSDKPRKSKKKKKRTGDDSDPEVFKKRPNIKFGGLNDDEEVGRRTRGKKINYLEALGSDSEDEMRRKPPRIEESEEEYIVQEDEEFKRKIENEKDSDESGPDAVLQDLAQMPHAKPKSRGRGKCGLKIPRKPKPTSEVSDMFSSVPTPAFHHSSDVFPPVSSDMFQQGSFPPGPSDMFPTAPEMYHNAGGVYPLNQQPPPLMEPGNPMQPTGYLMNQPILSNPLVQNQELHDIDDEPNPIEQINKNVEQMNEQEMEKMMEEEDYANKQLQLVALQLEKEKKRKEKEAQRLESANQAEQKIPKKRGRKPKNLSLTGSDLVSPYNDSSCLPMNSMMANNAELSEPPGISLPMFSDLVPALNADGTPRKRRGRGKGKKTLAAEAAALTGKDGSELEGLDCPSSSNSNTVSPAPDSPMHGSKLGIAAPPQPFSQSQPTPSVITRMLQSQSQPGAFSAKFFTSPAGDPSGPGAYHLGASGPRGLIPPGAYQQPPPGLPHYGVVRGAPPPLGIHASGAPPPGLPPMYHAHRTLDPSPSGGGPITVSTTSRDRHSPSIASPSSSSPISKGEPTPPPPPYTRPQVGHFPPVSGGNASIPLSGSRHVSMIPPPHLQHRSGSGSLSSPYHPGVPPNYHYGTYPPPSAHPPIGGDENQSPAVYPSAPYSENFIGDNGVPIPPSENSSGKPFEDDMGGEFVGLVSYFSSQREDDLDT